MFCVMWPARPGCCGKAVMNPGRDNDTQLPAVNTCKQIILFHLLLSLSSTLQCYMRAAAFGAHLSLLYSTGPYPGCCSKDKLLKHKKPIERDGTAIKQAIWSGALVTFRFPVVAAAAAAPRGTLHSLRAIVCTKRHSTARLCTNGNTSGIVHYME
jgi:hypothetical protein